MPEAPQRQGAKRSRSGGRHTPAQPSRPAKYNTWVKKAGLWILHAAVDWSSAGRGGAVVELRRPSIRAGQVNQPAILGERNRLAEHRVTFGAAVPEGVRSTMADCMTRVWLNAGATFRDHVRWSGVAVDTSLQRTRPA